MTETTPVLLYNNLFSGFGNVLSVFTTKIGGRDNFNLSINNGLDKDAALFNRTLLFNSLKIPEDKVVFEIQTHGTNISYADKSCTIEDNDGLITDKPGLYLTVNIADCIPFHIYDKERKVIASVHSGWQGTQKKILEKCLQKLIDEFRCSPENLFVYAGPSICRNCFETDADVANQFQEKYVIQKDKKYLIDLKKVNRDILKKFKVPDDNIQFSNYCTKKGKNLFHSYRRDREKSGRMFGILGIRGNT